MTQAFAALLEAKNQEDRLWARVMVSQENGDMEQRFHENYWFIKKAMASTKAAISQWETAQQREAQ